MTANPQPKTTPCYEVCCESTLRMRGGRILFSSGGGCVRRAVVRADVDTMLTIEKSYRESLTRAALPSKSLSHFTLYLIERCGVGGGRQTRHSLHFPTNSLKLTNELLFLKAGL